MSIVEFQDISKSFDKTQVLKPMSFTVASKSFVALLGPSGCGKTTLLRLLAGLEQVTSGEIQIDSKDVSKLAPKDRDIAMVFQSYALYPHMNVFDNMAFGLKMHKVPKAEIDSRVQEAAEVLGIQHLLRRKPKELSGGQRQRVALGRAIVRKPKVFLMDEPLSNLDAKLRARMRTELVKIHQRLGVTTLYVTHDQIEAMTMADQIVLMNQGVIHQIGKPLELYHQPKTKFVAGFIGNPPMNLIDASITQNQGELLLKNEFGSAQIKVSQKDFGGEIFTIGFRPEKLKLAPPTKTPASSFDLQIESIESLGSETILIGDFLGQRVQAKLTESRVQASLGEKLKVYLCPEDLHFFGRDGQRLESNQAQAAA